MLTGVYSIEYTEDLFLASVGVPRESFTERVRAELMRRMHGSLLNRINAFEGAYRVAVSSILSTNKLFIAPENCENAIYQFTFEKSHPVMVTYHAGEGGAVSADGGFALDNNFFRINSEEDVINAFETVSPGISEFLTVTRIR